MPGVQGKYTIDVTNRFGLTQAEDEEDDEIENVDPFEMINDLNQKAIEAKNAPKPKVPKAKKTPAPTPVAETKEEDKRVDNRGARGGARRGRGRGDGRPRGERPPRQNTDGVEGAPQREDRPRGGRGRGRGGPRRDGERRMDRRSGDPRSSVKGTDKREGAGAGNWGTNDDELKGQTETVEEKTTDETSAETPEEKPAEPAAPAEPEEVTLTLEEYRAQKRNVNRNPNARVSEQKEEATKAVDRENRKKGRAARVSAVDFKPAPLVSRGGDNRRGGGRGRGRGGQRGDRPRNNDVKKEDSGYNLADDFPSLGK